MATISYTTTFDLTGTPKIFTFEDTADYVGQGIALADVNGVFSITSPSGVVIYNNTDYSNVGCDIRNSVSRQNQLVIQLPLAADGFPEVGVYTIVYSVYDTNLAVYSTATNTYTYEYTRPEVVITQTVDCVSPLFTSTDATNYVVNATSPSSLIRQHILQFPLGSGLANLTSASSVITAGFEEFANGNQATQITTSLSYTFDDGLIVVDSITGAQAVTVDCTYICAVYCGLRSVEQQMAAAECNPAEYSRLTMLFAQLMALAQLAKLAIECGKPEDVTGYLDRMREIGNFTDDCSCGDSEAGLVTGLGGAGNTTVVESGDAVVIVTPVVVGSTTTYTVTLSTGFIASVTGHYNTIVLPGTNVTSVTDSGIIGGVRTFTVNGLPAGDATVPVTLHNNTTAVTTTTLIAGMQAMQAVYNLPAGTLADGESIEVIGIFNPSTSTAKRINLELTLNAVVCHTAFPTGFAQSTGTGYAKFVARITRKSVSAGNSNFFITFDIIFGGARSTTLTGYNLFQGTFTSAIDIDAVNLPIQFFAENLTAPFTETVTQNQFLVTYFNK